MPDISTLLESPGTWGFIGALLGGLVTLVGVLIEQRGSNKRALRTVRLNTHSQFTRACQKTRLALDEAPESLDEEELKRHILTETTELLAVYTTLSLVVGKKYFPVAEKMFQVSICRDLSTLDFARMLNLYRESALADSHLQASMRRGGRADLKAYERQEDYRDVLERVQESIDTNKANSGLGTVQPPKWWRRW